MATDAPPVIKAGGVLHIYEPVDLENLGASTEPVKWFFISADDIVYMGQADNNEDLTPDDYLSGLTHVPDDDVYPELPGDGTITIAPEHLDREAVFIRRASFGRHSRAAPGHKQATAHVVITHLWGELLILEKLSRRPHPYIVRYHGCRVRRGHITGLALEALEWTLMQYAADKRAEFAQIDKEAFLAGVESAVRYLHSLGLAHNDVAPTNIMVRQAEDGSCSPALIDFGSCAPIGAQILSGGSTGFSDTAADASERFASLARHDDYSLARVREWWDRVLETRPKAGEKAPVEDGPAQARRKERKERGRRKRGRKERGVKERGKKEY